VQSGIPYSDNGSGPNPDDQVRAEHENALARGEKRVLSRTVEGRLHSYAKDEIGIVTASSHPQVRSSGGFLVMAVVLAAVAVFSILLVAGPTSRGQDPMWSALVLTAAGVGGAVYALRMAKVASRAKRLRAERGIPEPTARQFDR
jgi:multisubunit Na+/H+ antiporter MnhC subunit